MTQHAFDFGATADIDRLRDALLAMFGPFRQAPERTPMEQLVRSMISGRTRDEVSLPAYGRLRVAYPDWNALADAPVPDILAVMGDVTFPEDKVRFLQTTLHAIRERHSDFDLAFLADYSPSAAEAWLQKLMGVGIKVAASALNYSTLCMRSFIADTHVIRVLKRLGHIGPKAGTREAHDFVMDAAPHYSAADLTELHVLIKTLGQRICHHAHPACRSCPLARECRFH